MRIDPFCPVCDHDTHDPLCPECGCHVQGLTRTASPPPADAPDLCEEPNWGGWTLCNRPRPCPDHDASPPPTDALREAHKPEPRDSCDYDSGSHWLGCSCGWNNEPGSEREDQEWWDHIAAAPAPPPPADALHEALPVAAVYSAIRWVEENIAPRRCDSDGVADCWRCTTVAIARWLDAAVAAVGQPALDVDQIADAIFDVENFAYSGGPETTEVMERYRESVYEKARAIHARLTGEGTP